MKVNEKKYISRAFAYYYCVYVDLMNLALFCQFVLGLPVLGDNNQYEYL